MKSLGETEGMRLRNRIHKIQLLSLVTAVLLIYTVNVYASPLNINAKHIGMVCEENRIINMADNN